MLNSSFRNKLVLKLCFRDKVTLNPEFRNKLQLQLEQPDGFIVNFTLFKFSSQLHTQIDMTRLCEHHSLIIQNSLYIINDHIEL